MTKPTPILTKGLSYTKGPYRWSEEYQEVTISVPGYGGTKRVLNVTRKEATPEKLEALRIAEGARIVEIIEAHSLTFGKEEVAKKKVAA